MISWLQETYSWLNQCCWPDIDLQIFSINVAIMWCFGHQVRLACELAVTQQLLSWRSTWGNQTPMVDAVQDKVRGLGLIDTCHSQNECRIFNMHEARIAWTYWLKLSILFPSINSLRPSDAKMCQYSRSSLFQIMACLLHVRCQAISWTDADLLTIRP